MSTVNPVDTIYVVQAGDTLGTIAAKFYGDAKVYAVIAAKNGLKDPNKIQVGQKLVIPADIIAGAAMTAADNAFINRVFTGQNAATAQANSVPAAPAGSPVTRQTIETMTVTAQRPWYTDWRIWAGVSVAAVLWVTLRRKR